VTPFGLPFEFWTVTANVPVYGSPTTQPSHIIGAQINPGTATTADRIARQDGGNFGYILSSTSLWAGSLQTNATMIPGRAYWYQNKSGAPRTVVLAGDVNNSGGYGTVPVSHGVPVSSAALSWRDSRNLVLQTQVGPGLVAAGFRGGTAVSSDLLSAQVGGLIGRVSADETTWGGSMVDPLQSPTLGPIPGQAYWIQNRVHALPDPQNWTYDYAITAAAAASSVNDGVALPAPAITKVPVVAKESVKTSSVKTNTVKANSSSAK